MENAPRKVAGTWGADDALGAEASVRAVTGAEAAAAEGGVSVGVSAGVSVGVSVGLGAEAPLDASVALRLPESTERLQGAATPMYPTALAPAMTPVALTLRWEHGRLTAVEATSSDVAQFLDFVRVRHAYNTWVNYACDLKAFFATVGKPPDQVTREDCVRFMDAQGAARRTVSTINRRLATVSSLFEELLLRDPARFADNPVVPRLRKAARTLYKRAPKRLPDIVAEPDLRALFAALPTWRDRTLLLLQWVSCLRISEALAIRFADMECSQKRIRIRASKNHDARDVYMDDSTFTAFNRYLDHERAALERAGAVIDENAIFLTVRGPNRGRQLSVNAVQKLLTYYAAKCTLPHLHAHLLRHTGITQLLEHDMPEPAVRKLVGHKRPESLLPYVHLTDRFTEREFQRAAPALDHWRIAADPSHQQLVGARHPP